MFSSIPSVVESNMEKLRKTHPINTELRGWCYHRNFGFLDHEVFYWSPVLMAADRINLDHGEQTSLFQDLFGIIDSAFNSV